MSGNLFCIGEMVVDFTPDVKQDSYVFHPGGAPANVAIAAKRLGVNSSFTGKVGNDVFGKRLQNVLLENGVIIGCRELCDTAVTTMAFVSVSADGERSFTFARKPGADMFLKIPDIDENLLRDADIVHAGACSLSAEPACATTKYVLQRAKSMGKIISFDVNYRNLMWEDQVQRARKEIDEAVQYVDFLKISDEELYFVGGEKNIFSYMDKMGVSVVARTRGEEGAEVYYHGGVLSEKGIRAPQIADTNGAGDAFWAAFLASLLQQGVNRLDELSEVALRKAL